ncbi:MAG TPA: histidine phosphatase family protein [Candidatus Binatia bacterium]|nr:histidine phosphatase family protein [Candidatus Binatia bacterium]
MAIYLVRHAETDANASRVVQRPDVGLSARGRGQAARLAARLARAGIVRIRTSDLVRALETAEVLRAATGAPMDVDPDLAERNFGDVRGTPYASLGTDLFAPDYEPPGGETWAEFHARVDGAWASVLRVATATPGHLAVVTHGLVCEAVLQRYLGGADAAVARWPNTAVTIVEPPATLRLLACAMHLDDASADGGAV